VKWKCPGCGRWFELDEEPPRDRDYDADELGLDPEEGLDA
jgi:hypothetical protein